MTDIHDRAVRAASAVSWSGSLAPRHAARRIQDAALRDIDRGVLQRLAQADGAFDVRLSEFRRVEVAEVAGSPRPRRFSPVPDLLAVFAAGFGGGLAIGAGQVVSRTPAGRMALVGSVVLVLAIVAIALLIVGAVVAARAGAATTARALFLWFAAFFSAVAIVGVSVRLVAEDTTVAGIVAVIAMAVVLVFAIVLAIGATRRRRDDTEEFASRAAGGACVRNELLSESENAQDRAHHELDGLEPAAREAFLDACAVGIREAGRRELLSRATVKRLQSPDWAAARYDIAE